MNNAGITRDARLINLTDDDFGLVIDVNLGAAYRLTRALVPAMIDGGAVVNLASRAYSPSTAASSAPAERWGRSHLLWTGDPPP